MAGVHAVDVIQDGAEVLKAVVEPLVVTEGSFGAVPEVVVADVLNAGAEQRAFFRRRQKSQRRAGVPGGE